MIKTLTGLFVMYLSLLAAYLFFGVFLILSLPVFLIGIILGYIVRAYAYLHITITRGLNDY